jgi:hypothetical protein
LSRYFGYPGVEKPATLGRLPEGAGPMCVVTKVTSDCRGLLCAVSGSVMGSTSFSTPRAAVTGSREQVVWGVEKLRRKTLWRGSPRHPSTVGALPGATPHPSRINSGGSPSTLRATDPGPYALRSVRRRGGLSGYSSGFGADNPPHASAP